MQVPSRRVLRLLRCPRGAPSSARMRHIFPPSRRSLISSMASSGPALALARRVASVTAALRLNPPLRHVSRFPRGSQNMTSDSRVKGKGLGKPDRHCLIPSANDPIHTTKDIMISMNKHFPIEENKAGVEEFVPRYSDGHPANNEDGSKIAIYGNEHVCRTTVEVTDGRQDLRGAVQEVKDGEDAGDQMASEVSDDDAYEEFTDDDADEEFSSCEDSYPRDDSIHWMVLRRSTHRDGSIYRGTFGSGWKNDYRIADRSESDIPMAAVTELMMSSSMAPLNRGFVPWPGSMKFHGMKLHAACLK